MAAKACAMRESLRFGLVTDTKLIKQLKVQYGGLWFSDDRNALSTMIV